MNGYNRRLSSYVLQAAYGIIADNICCSGLSKQPQQMLLDYGRCGMSRMEVSMACSHAWYGLWHDVCLVPVPAQLLGPEQDLQLGAWALKGPPQGCGCRPDPGEEQQNQLPQQSPCSHTQLSESLSDLHTSTVPKPCRQGASAETAAKLQLVCRQAQGQDHGILHDTRQA